ncbi:MAG: hypothetical protein QW756_01935 [Nitrososphaerota archaeon]
MTERPPSREMLERLAARYGARNLLRRCSKYYSAGRFQKMGEGRLLRIC